MITRYSSRRQRLDRSFLTERLRGALRYDRIAGYFSSSLLEVAGEELEHVAGQIRVVCNSDLHPHDVRTARAAEAALRRAWCGTRPEALLQGEGEPQVRNRFQRLYAMLTSGKLVVKVLPDSVFGLIHGKAGVITCADGSATSFIGSVNESKFGWQINYELLWEDSSSEAVAWVQEEFDALWNSPYAVPLAEAVIQDLERLARRQVISTVAAWTDEAPAHTPPDPASALVETPVYRREAGLWEHQKYFVKTVIDAHHGPQGKARYILADQVGLGKTLQLAMAAKLIALAGTKPVLVICPKTLVWQWQTELADLLDMPSAGWNGKQWVDERGFEYPAAGPEAIRRCPRRVGIISGGLISYRSAAVEHLLKVEYDCVILDEAHRARRQNLGDRRDGEKPDPNNLLDFMYKIAERTRSLLLATATPVQLRPIEAWDLLSVLGYGDESVLGNAHSRWRQPVEALNLIMGRRELPRDENEQWEWLRNPLPLKAEGPFYERLRRELQLNDDVAVANGSRLMDLNVSVRSRLCAQFGDFIASRNPFICRIIRRTRKQLEEQIHPESGEPLLDPIHVDVLGERDEEAISVPVYLQTAYERAEQFCKQISVRMRGAGFLKTLLLRRVGSTVYAGKITAERMLGDWANIEEPEQDDDEFDGEPQLHSTDEAMPRTLTPTERDLLECFVDALVANQGRDPKYEKVRELLIDHGWLQLGCIVFSQYRDSIQWLAERLTEELPDEPIALYSGSSNSGIIQGGEWHRQTRDELKNMVRLGQLRLLLGTDAASEGLNLQMLARLINLDLPWNPTRLEQRKGRIQRIGQTHNKVAIYNLRYRGSVEDRVHELLSSRLQDIFQLFGQIPDVLEDAWVAVALGEQERARKIIDEIPRAHPFEIRYAKVEPVDWESCATVLDAAEQRRVLSQGWYNNP
ncbi:DEAD/DEAH box helicase family protein [Candidatus Chloroploca sp. M-50]|uniref:DEAD/DEAH box helicase family protein n=1 Tax=Candidatus Chloroploca mongolica TaxID=2528176 RepID=A0ABS4D4Z2_9CHLR|nr:phospholipase D-like domain-containing anti-phage protein [Candidatus Chloroploca mongolica]MBP1464506.1 DEAD/DEAH box helicase family protein [Candidatus Chloroploca mongolica]